MSRDSSKLSIFVLNNLARQANLGFQWKGMALHCMGVVYDSMTRVTPRPTCQISRDPATSASWEVLHRTRNIIWILYTRPHAQRPQQPHPHGQGAHFNGVVARTISVFGSCALCRRLHYIHGWLSSRILLLAINYVLQLKCWPHLAIQSSKRAKKNNNSRTAIYHHLPSHILIWWIIASGQAECRNVSR